MAVSLGHSRDLMTIAQVSYHVTVSVQPCDKLCCFCHFTGCVGTVILPGVLLLSLFPYYHVTSQSRPTPCCPQHRDSNVTTYYSEVTSLYVLGIFVKISYKCIIHVGYITEFEGCSEHFKSGHENVLKK